MCCAVSVMELSISHHFLACLKVQEGQGFPLSLGFPSLLWVRMGQSWAVHLWSGILIHHQGAPVYLSPLEVPSGPQTLALPKRRSW